MKQITVFSYDSVFAWRHGGKEVRKEKERSKESTISFFDIIQWKIREAFLHLFDVINEKN